MLDHFPFYIGLVFAIVLLVMLANKLRVAYPVLLVIAGLIISIVPSTPKLHIDPELIFFIFLPPLLYESAWAISWKELWKWRRIVSSFAFVVVFFTATSVALVSNAMIPGFSIALGFLLGGIVSPPDAVSASAILKFVKVPKRMSSILEGESLLNDASSLIIFRFALIAVGTGQFVWYSAALSFVWMVIGGTCIGLLIGWLFMKMHRYLPTNANMDIILTIITPYFMYIAAELANSSGVLAVVCGGLFLSNKRNSFLSGSARLRAVNVWESFVFVLNGLVFLLIGLDLPQITEGLEGVSLSDAIGYGLLVTGVLILSRFFSAFAAVVVTLVMRNFITVADSRSPGYKAPIVMGWAGMRGVVSLAAALSIPVYLESGEGFPQRNLILFMTFVVILTTLVLQGLTLPVLIRKIKLPEFDDYTPEDELDATIRRSLAERSLHFLHTHHGEVLQHDIHLRQLAEKWEGKADAGSEITMPVETKSIYLAVLNEQRQWLVEKNESDPHCDEELIRKHLQLIDLEEEKLRFL